MCLVDGNIILACWVAWAVHSCKGFMGACARSVHGLLRGTRALRGTWSLRGQYASWCLHCQ